MDKQNLTSISFPVLGAGKLKFAAESVASITFETAIEFLNKNK